MGPCEREELVLWRVDEAPEFFLTGAPPVEAVEVVALESVRLVEVFC